MINALGEGETFSLDRRLPIIFPKLVVWVECNTTNMFWSEGKEVECRESTELNEHPVDQLISLRNGSFLYLNFIMYWPSLFCMFLISLGFSSSWRGKTKKTPVRSGNKKSKTEFSFVWPHLAHYCLQFTLYIYTNLQPGAGYWRSSSPQLSYSNFPPAKIPQTVKEHPAIQMDL